MAETPCSYAEYLEMDLDDLMKLARDQLEKRKPTV